MKKDLFMKRSVISTDQNNLVIMTTKLRDLAKRENLLQRFSSSKRETLLKEEAKQEIERLNAFNSVIDVSKLFNIPVYRKETIRQLQRMEMINGHMSTKPASSRVYLNLAKVG
jgi:hypothetical protein